MARQVLGFPGISLCHEKFADEAAARAYVASAVGRGARYIDVAPEYGAHACSLCVVPLYASNAARRRRLRTNPRAGVQWYCACGDRRRSGAGAPRSSPGTVGSKQVRTALPVSPPPLRFIQGLKLWRLAEQLVILVRNDTSRWRSTTDFVFVSYQGSRLIFDELLKFRTTLCKSTRVRSYFLACKTMFRDAKGARADLDTSLAALGVAHFDLYQVPARSPPCPLPLFPPLSQHRRPPQSEVPPPSQIGQAPRSADRTHRAVRCGVVSTERSIAVRRCIR